MCPFALDHSFKNLLMHKSMLNLALGKPCLEKEALVAAGSASASDFLVAQVWTLLVCATWAVLGLS